MQDALEVIDKTKEDYFEHELFTPAILRQQLKDKPQQLKMAGNIVVPGKHIRKILLDRKFQALYDLKKEEEIAQAAKIAKKH